MPGLPSYPTVVLTILDGWGLGDSRLANAPALAHTPNFDRLMATCPNAKLTAHGRDVGLPDGQMGNSEVGHMNIGAGRIVMMDLPRIDDAIAEGSFAQNPALERFASALKASGGTAHVAGLASDGGVHSHQRHMVEAVRQLQHRGVPVKLHLFTDGRDTDRKAALRCLREMAEDLGEPLPAATVMGRFFAMDRDQRWERIERAATAMTRGSAGADVRVADDAADAVRDGWKRGETDEFIEPTAINGYRGMADGDGLFFTNFRTDRAREILSALCDPDFAEFDVSARPAFAAVLGMVRYSARHEEIMDTAFPPIDIRNTLGEWVSVHGRSQMRLAETEKYPHVTFFLNGGREETRDGEHRHMAPSPKVRTYDLMPEMAEREVTEHVVAAIEEGTDLIVVNYANPDMVGHTGSLMATIRACEAVDRGLGAVLDALRKAGGAMVVTADHGNCEQMLDPKTYVPHTAHTLNPVPVILTAEGAGDVTLADGRLADLAPTLLELMGLPQPPEMTGRSLIRA